MELFQFTYVPKHLLRQNLVEFGMYPDAPPVDEDRGCENLLK